MKLKLSKQIEIWRDVMAHYEDRPERQRQLFDELVRTLRQHIMHPP